MHTLAALGHNTAVVTLGVHKGKNTGCTAQRDFVLGGIASGYYGNFLLHEKDRKRLVLTGDKMGGIGAPPFDQRGEIGRHGASKSISSPVAG